MQGTLVFGHAPMNDRPCSPKPRIAAALDLELRTAVGIEIGEILTNLDAARTLCQCRTETDISGANHAFQ